MKSLLVDALRQAKSGDQSEVLSDSGSYDTTGDGFLTTANDAVVLPENATDDELELFETSAVDATLDHDYPEKRDGESEEGKPSESAHIPLAASNDNAVDALHTASRRVPVMARFVPVSCVLLAVLAAAFWFAVQRVSPGYPGSVFSASSYFETSRSALSAGVTNSRASAKRFPFIEPAADSGDEEAAE